MRESTKKKYIEIVKEIANAEMTIAEYIKTYNKSKNLYNQLKQANDSIVDDSVINDEFTFYYEKITGKSNEYNEDIDNDQQSETSYVRDENGHIKYYQYKIYRKNKLPLAGRLTREEMNSIYRLYTYYGDNLTARVVSRSFPDFSLADFKRIVRAFMIYKDSSSFAPHMYEEYSENELRDIQLREKENSFLRKAEEDRIKDNEKLLKKYAQENIELKKQIEELSGFKVEIPNIEPYYFKEYPEANQSINLYISDMHLGSYTTSGSLYNENRNYGYNEAKRRLEKVIDFLGEMGGFDDINIFLCGDNIDCCGIANRTASLTHNLPENMDPREQCNKFLEIMMWFIDSLCSNYNKLCNKIRIMSVPNGNHGGSLEYACNKAFLALINAKYPDIKTELFEKFYGVFKEYNNTWIITHGKTGDGFMKKGFPLNLDDKTKNLIYEWLNDNGIYEDNIHFIKGDLHSNNMNSCKRFTYRNVLSLYGASDYSSYGFSRNSYGLSYDLIINNNVLSGTIENM